MASIMFTDNSLNGLDTDTREYVTWSLDALDEDVNLGAFMTYEEARDAAWELFDAGIMADIVTLDDAFVLVYA